jgi:hypothetical protein
MGNALSRIVGSRKAILSILGIVCVMYMSKSGQVSGTEALGFIKWVLMAWLGAQAAEDVAMHLKGSHPGNPPPVGSTPAPAPVATDPTKNSDPPSAP